MKPMKQFTAIVIAAFYIIGLFACNQTNSKATSYRASIKRDDGFPYSSGADQYWTGYFSSRPNLK
jgi:hypothetical protein